MKKFRIIFYKIFLLILFSTQLSAVFNKILSSKYFINHTSAYKSLILAEDILSEVFSYYDFEEHHKQHYIYDLESKMVNDTEFRRNKFMKLPGMQTVYIAHEIRNPFLQENEIEVYFLYVSVYIIKDYDAKSFIVLTEEDIERSIEENKLKSFNFHYSVIIRNGRYELESAKYDSLDEVVREVEPLQENINLKAEDNSYIQAIATPEARELEENEILPYNHFIPIETSTPLLGEVSNIEDSSDDEEPRYEPISLKVANNSEEPLLLPSIKRRKDSRPRRILKNLRQSFRKINLFTKE